jgi:predicted unusual protein kinase regulating ubiquinone biosynthesis (AarF/ABC1/UbiB family)
MEVLKEAHKQGFGYDLHDGNFMVRNNGDIVITDPLVY